MRRYPKSPKAHTHMAILAESALTIESPDIRPIPTRLFGSRSALQSPIELASQWVIVVQIHKYIIVSHTNK